MGLCSGECVSFVQGIFEMGFTLCAQSGPASDSHLSPSEVLTSAGPVPRDTCFRC